MPNITLSKQQTELLDQHAMNAVEIAFHFTHHDRYAKWKSRCHGILGGMNGETDLLCDMAMAMTTLERSLSADSPWDSSALPLDWRECCEIFANSVIEHMLLTGARAPVRKILQHVVKGRCQ